MIAFTIEPFVGPLPLRFGMLPKTVEELLGPPNETRSNHLGNRTEFRKNVNLGYLAPHEKLRTAVFTPGATLILQGHELFQVADPIRLLQKWDSSPKLFVGHVIFLKLGVSVSGYHDNDESQKAIAVYDTGYWNEFLDDFVPFE